MNAQASSMEFLPYLRNQSLLYHEQYCIQNVLGYGHSSWSYLALDQNLDLPVVIKEFFPHGHCQRVALNGKVSLYDQSKREFFVYGSEKFIEDARRLAYFNNYPGTVKIYNLFKQNGTIYLVMEYQPGQTLDLWLQNDIERPGWKESVQALTPVLEALQAMHSVGVTRGDICPEVIYRCQDGRLMMLDISSPQLERRQQRPVLSPIVVPGYAAFEQHTSPASSGPWSDVHAAAALLFWMISDQLVPSALERAVNDAVPAMIMNCPAVPAEGKEILTRGLAFKKRERYLSSQEFLEGLQQSLHNASIFNSMMDGVDGNEANMNPESIIDAEQLDDMAAEALGGDYTEESYSGKSRFGWKHGQGSQIYKNGDKYNGEWLLGRRHGYGTLIYPNGDQYKGQWKWDRKNGQGTMQLANGDKYIGEWKDDQRSGQGKEILANSERYVGQWKNGKRSGPGTEVFSNGDRYVGEWLYGLRNGQGTETFANGDKYAGEWKADKRNGQGKEFMSNGEQYEGEFKDGRRHGFGTLKLPNGDEYDGDWKMGRRRIKEPIFEPDGRYEDDLWRNRRYSIH